MVQEILDNAARSSYDFRLTAFPEDPLQYLFADWVPYYRMKWAIARVLQPRRILEVGVRFGYSAAAFLDACPDSEYLGIDNDSEMFGGYKGAINWARKITRDAKAEYLLADSQQLAEFPGGCYDLIHVDGQQDGAGSFRDLRKALRQARHILVDGFFWTRQNFLNASEFLYRHRDQIESCVVIPGYEGELLITVSGNSRETVPMLDFGHGRGEAGAHLARVYRSLARLAEIAPVGQALDLACSRLESSSVPGGELVAQLASRYLTGLGHQALVLSRETVNSAPLAGPYDVAVVSELIEHLPPREVDTLYQRIADHLSPDGFCIVHTFPNSWFYRYGHPHRRRAAQKLGAYLPLEPRSCYEELRHINEQSPRELKRQLRKYFPHVIVWFADDPDNLLTNLQRRFSRNEIRSAAHLYAVASRFPIDVKSLLERLETQPLPSQLALQLQIVSAPAEVPAESRFRIRVRLVNQSASELKSRDPFPVHLAYHCYAENGDCVVFDGERTSLPIVKPGAAREIDMNLQAPPAAGRMLFRLTLVQEKVRWMDTAPQNLFAEEWIRVVGP